MNDTERYLITAYKMDLSDNETNYLKNRTGKYPSPVLRNRYNCVEFHIFVVKTHLRKLKWCAVI